MTPERHERSDRLLILILCGLVLVLLMLGYWFYPFPSGKRPDLWSFVVVWLRELIALALGLFALFVVALSAWTTRRQAPESIRPPVPSATSTISEGANATPTQLVAVLLSSQCLPRVVEVSGLQDESADVTLDGRAFKRRSAGGMLGFYDWLRDGRGRVVGVRQYIDDGGDFPWEKSFRGVRRGVSKKELLVFFDGEQAFDEGSSSDQDFGDNFLLADGDLIAITFSARGLGQLAGA